MGTAALGRPKVLLRLATETQRSAKKIAKRLDLSDLTFSVSQCLRGEIALRLC